MEPARILISKVSLEKGYDDQTSTSYPNIPVQLASGIQDNDSS